MSGGHTVGPGRAAELIDAGATLVDVRRPYEYVGGHLPGARNIEMNEVAAAAADLARERPVIFYCRSGNRSSMAVAAFSEAGFDAHNIAGGIQAGSQRTVRSSPPMARSSTRCHPPERWDASRHSTIRPGEAAPRRDA